MFRFLLVALLFLLPFADAHAQVAPTENYSFSGKDAATSIGEAILKTGSENEVKVTINGASDEIIIATASNPISADVDDLQLDKAHNRWEATLYLKAEGKNLSPVKLSGKYDEMTSLPVLKRRLMSGDVISRDDIEWTPWPQTNLRKNTITDANDLIGKSPKRMISQERPVRLDEVASPAIILKGARVTLLYKTPNIEIKTLGEAMENGAKGEVIRVKNVTSKAIIMGTVEAPDCVRISSPDDVSAEAM